MRYLSQKGLDLKGAICEIGFERTEVVHKLMLFNGLTFQSRGQINVAEKPGFIITPTCVPDEVILLIDL